MNGFERFYVMKSALPSSELLCSPLSDVLIRVCSEVHLAQRELLKKKLSVLFAQFEPRSFCIYVHFDLAN